MLEINNLTKRKIDYQKTDRLVRKFFSIYRIREAQLSLVLIGDKKSKELNFKYRKKNKLTDVLSFSNSNFQHEVDNLLGEIFINLSEVYRLNNYRELFLELSNLNSTKRRSFFSEMIKKESLLGKNIFPTKAEKDLAREYLFLFILMHGILHLIGFNDEEEGERRMMIELGFNLLEKIFKK